VTGFDDAQQSLTAYLRTLSLAQLEGLLTQRPDATIEPAPATPDSLAARLLHPRAIASSLTVLTLPRALRGLRLTLLAPTVLASAKDQAETLVTLRAAGYAPSAVLDGGVDRVARNRDSPGVERKPANPDLDLDQADEDPQLAEPIELARRIHANR
jgi:hypothetical protein